MIITVLGSGTSSGIPTISCQCPTCTSSDSKDKRLRTSLLVESDRTTVLIDTSPDFRQQMLINKIAKIDAVVYTHSHFDHICGFDDLRAFNYTMEKAIPIYLTEITLAHIQKTFFYAFEKTEQIGGGVPLVEKHLIDVEPFVIGDIHFIPITLKHGKLDVLGFRIGNFAFLTDTNFIPDENYTKLENLEILIIDALRFEPHPTHFTVDQAINEIRKIKPRNAYLTHLAHQIRHSVVEKTLPENIFLSYDGLRFEL